MTTRTTQQDGPKREIRKRTSLNVDLDPNRRVICPYCTAELSYSYLSLHKQQYCPMRPERLKAIADKGRGSLDGLPPFSSVKYVGQFIKGIDKEKDFQNKNVVSGFLDSGMGIIEIDLNEEYKAMAPEIVKPKSEKSEKKYKCEKCETEFDEKLKFCPGCGIEFG